MWAILTRNFCNYSSHGLLTLIEVEKITPKCIFSEGIFAGTKYLKKRYRIDVFGDKKTATNRFNHLQKKLGTEDAETKRIAYLNSYDKANRLVREYAIREPDTPCPKIYTKPAKQEN